MQTRNEWIIIKPQNQTESRKGIIFFKAIKTETTEIIYQVLELKGNYNTGNVTITNNQFMREDSSKFKQQTVLKTMVMNIR